jgi:hypothetical protein
VSVRGSQRGQATIELVAMLPVLAAAALGALQLLAAGATAELAGHAAEAGAVAVLERQDPVAAARAALPGWSRGGLAVRVDGQRVRVRLRPPPVAGPLADLLAADAVASAGTTP